MTLDWYKDAVIYQLHVRSFFDSTGDGIGDFKGLAQKLDYLQDLGVTAIWLMPFYPSPLRDDGYDIANYREINPMYGSLKDFKAFVKAAHARDLRVITELVINHTSDQHPWFQKARTAKPGSTARNFYVWSDDPTKYKETRIIFTDFEPSNWTWDPVAQSYFWHRFYSHQPDLNFDEPEVHKAVLAALHFWMEMGIDGLRLDAIPYLYEREGTNCENLPETHAFLQKLRVYVDEHFPGRMLLAEANQWPEDSVAYFGSGNECHTAFHFPLMPRLYMGLHSEDRLPILDILEQTPAIPDNCQWVIFLRNHDELTLEMVTDDERDYMYRAYALDQQMRINVGIRRRLAPLLGNNRDKIELMNGLLFSLPGTPVIYYGDEIGMGDNVYLGDRNGVRTPMQWSNDRNAGFSTANPQRLFSPLIIDPEYSYETINAETQQRNPESLLWWMRRLIALRQRYSAFGRGTFEALSPDNPKVLAYLRRFEDQTLLVVANLSRFTQYAELDLSAFSGARPLELFGQSHFPAIGRAAYPLTLGPYGFCWFALEQSNTVVDQKSLPDLLVPEKWQEVFTGSSRRTAERLFAKILPRQRWFGGKSRVIQAVHVTDQAPLGPKADPDEFLWLALEVQYSVGHSEQYSLLLGHAAGAAAEQLMTDASAAILATTHRREDKEKGVLFEAVSTAAGAATLYETIAREREIKTAQGTIVARDRGEKFPALTAESVKQALGAGPEQSNSSVVVGDKLIFKMLRRIEPGLHPETEIVEALAKQAQFTQLAPVHGSIEYRRDGQPAALLNILQTYYPDTINARQMMMDWLGRYLESIVARAEPLPPCPALAHDQVWKKSFEELPPVIKDAVGSFWEQAHLLGQRTGEMHAALAKLKTRAFDAEPFTPTYQRELYQTARKQVTKTWHQLRTNKSLPESAQEAAKQVQGLQKKLLAALHGILEQKVPGTRIRCHGDYHLAQVLYTGKDYIVIDFEGMPTASLVSRRIKQSPLRDVAGMIRSLHYAAEDSCARFGQLAGNSATAAQQCKTATAWWYHATLTSFLQGYREATNGLGLLPEDSAAIDRLLGFYLLEKVVNELSYELNHRQESVGAALSGIIELLG
jgi:maltose alpha-D-glucosyltransferase/alpha-amylase